MKEHNNLGILNFNYDELLCGLNVYPILKYMEKCFGYQKMRQLIEPLGYPVNYLSKKTNWIPYDYYCQLLDLLVRETGNPQAPYLVYTELDAEEFFSEILDSLYPINLFISHNQDFNLFFNVLFELKVSKTINYRFMPSSRNSLEIQYFSSLGYASNDHYCSSLYGYLQLISTYLKLQDIKIKYSARTYQKTSYNVFKIKWTLPGEKLKYATWLVSILYTAGAVVYLISRPFQLTHFMIALLLLVIILLTQSQLLLSVVLKKKNKLDFFKHNLLIKSIRKINQDFYLKEAEKWEIIELNRYLITLENIKKLTQNVIYFNPLIYDIANIIIDEYKFYKGCYYFYDPNRRTLVRDFEISNEILAEKVISQFDFFPPELSLAELELIVNNKVNLRLNDFFKIINQKQPAHEHGGSIYYIRIPLSEGGKGLLLLYTPIQFSFSLDLINRLFKQISEELNKCQIEISTRNEIEHILTSIPAYVIIFNVADFKIKYVNHLFISHYEGIASKLTKSDIVGEDLFSILSLDEPVKTRIIDFTKNMSQVRNLERLQVRSKSEVWEYNLFFIKQNEKAQKSAGLIINDITDAEYFQQNLLINEKLIALGKVATGIAHEIKNPLYAIMANTEEILEDENISEQSIEFCNDILEYVMNISHIITDVSDYSKTLRKEDLDFLDLNAVIEESLKLISYSTKMALVKIEKDFRDIPEFKAKKGEMQQIFINLFNNALQAMGGQGIIKIKTYFDQSQIKIVIADSGCGISEENSKNIFDLYYTTKEAGKGSGQGLHIVKKMVNKYHGEIHFKSQVGEGTVFYLSFKLNH